MKLKERICLVNFLYDGYLIPPFDDIDELCKFVLN
jgi:hypothetical protein